MASNRQALFVDSLYRHAAAVQAEDGSVIFLNPERLPYIERDDTIQYNATGLEYLWEIALTQYGTASVGNIDLAEVIAQFQPEPIQDLSVPVPENTELLIPSMDYIEEIVRGPSLIDEAVL